MLVSATATYLSMDFGGLAGKTAMRPTDVVKYVHNIVSALGLANILEVYKLYQAVLIATGLAPQGQGFVSAFLEGAHKAIDEGTKNLIQDYLKDWGTRDHLVDIIEEELAQEVGQVAARNIIENFLEWFPVISAGTKVQKDLNTIASVLAGKVIELHSAAFIENAIIHELYVTQTSR